MGKKVCLIILLCVFWGITGCGRKASENAGERVIRERLEIGVVTKSRDSEYWMSVCSGMENAAQEFGMYITFLYPDTENDVKIQKKMIRGLIKKGVDAIAISPIDSYNNEDYMELANEKKIPVYAYDTRIMDASVPYIGVDNYKVGYELAEKLADILGYHGEVGIVSGKLEQVSHLRRLNGFRDYMNTQKDMKIVFVESGYSNLKMSENEIQRLEKAYPNLRGIMATSAVTALGIIEGLENQETKVVSVDEQEDAMMAVSNGEIAALAAQSGYDIGYETIRYIWKDLHGEDLEKEKILDTEIITPENVEKYSNLKK